MSTNFDDILSAICSHVSAVSANDFQSIYMLGDAKEAKLAQDILISYGFEAKLYSDVENESGAAKLYVNRPPADSKPQPRLDAALAYAHGLKSIKTSLDSLYRDPAIGVQDYSVTFANSPTSGKQINILLNPTAIALEALMPAPPKPKPRPQAQAAARKGPAKKSSKPVEDDMEGFSARSALAKSYKIGGKHIKGGQEDDAVRNWFSRIFVQHVAANSMDMLLALAGVLAIVSLAIMSKSFLCPDLAVATHKQNHAWYCVRPEDDDSSQKPNQLPAPPVR